MKKSDWQYLVDTLLFISIMGIVIIGFLLGLVIPKGPSVAESAKYFLGLHRHEWGNIHFFLSIAFTALVFVHLIFSWKWIKMKAKQIFKQTWRTSLILVLFLAIITPLLIWNFWPKYAETYSDPGIGPRGRDAYWGSQDIFFSQDGERYIAVTGQETLADLEKATGISPQTFIEKLNLPKRTKKDETLGFLRKRYGFELQDVRDIITALSAAPAGKPENKEEVQEKIVFAEIPRKPDAAKETEAEETEHEDKVTRGRLAADPSGFLITGQMTLKDIEKLTNIPARTLAEKLGLPPTVSFYEQIGRLKRTHRITIQDIRDAVSSLLKGPEDWRTN